jgi:TPR repeat protein
MNATTPNGATTMPARRHCLALCLGLYALSGSVLDASAEPTPAQVPMAQAQQAYYQGQYRQALQRFERLAASGNAEAAEAAGFMLLLGEPLYGAQVPCDLPRARAYLVQAARSGRAGAGFMLNMIERTD